jgi:hypothetical protein
MQLDKDYNAGGSTKPSHCQSTYLSAVLPDSHDLFNIINYNYLARLAFESALTFLSQNAQVQTYVHLNA